MYIFIDYFILTVCVIYIYQENWTFISILAPVSLQIFIIS